MIPSGNIKSCALETLRILDTSKDDGERQSYLLWLFKVLYQQGIIDAQADMMMRRAGQKSVH